MKFRSIRSILLFLIFLIILLIVTQYYYIKSILFSKVSKRISTYQKINTDHSDEIDQCHKQWFMLNNHMYFRPHLAYYYLDLKQLKMYYSRHLKFNYNLTLNINISIRNSNVSIKKSTKDYKTYLNQQIDGFNFLLESIVINNLTLNDLFSNNKQLALINDYKTDLKIQVLIETQDQKSKLNQPIELRIKNFRESNKFKKKAMLCSKQFFFDDNYSKSFAWWIELNRMHGYDKLVFYNHSIPNSKYLNDLFRKHSDFIEIKQLQCYPNFEVENNSQRLFIKNSDFKDVFKIDPLYHHAHYEFLCFNECYFENMDKYVHIAVHDQDESILPRRIEKFKVINPNTKFNSDDFNTNNCSKSFHMSDYFKHINNKLKTNENYKNYDLTSTNGTLTYHFLMTLYFGHDLMEQIFNKLNEYFKLNKQFKIIVLNITDPNDVNFYGRKPVSFNVSITSENDYEYAKRLNDLYVKKIKPFLERNRNVIKQLPEPFSRLFFVNGPTTTWMCGKTVHNTQMSVWVSTHYPEGNDFKNTVIFFF